MSAAKNRVKRVAAMSREHEDFRKRLHAITEELRARREANEDVWGVSLEGRGGHEARVAAALATGKDES